MTVTEPSPAMRWSIAPGVLHRVVGDEVFVLMPDSRVHWLKRPSARSIWESLAKTPTIELDMIVSLLVKHFDADPGEIRSDTIEFLKDLEDRGAIIAIR